VFSETVRIGSETAKGYYAAKLSYLPTRISAPQTSLCHAVNVAALSSSARTLGDPAPQRMTAFSL
jgi:hypothetical protein